MAVNETQIVSIAWIGSYCRSDGTGISTFGEEKLFSRNDTAQKKKSKFPQQSQTYDQSRCVWTRNQQNTGSTPVGETHDDRFSPLNHNAPCLPPNIMHNCCFKFLLGITVSPREIENNSYAKFWRYCGIIGTMV